jgi:biopolymer transport protein ExbD
LSAGTEAVENTNNLDDEILYLRRKHRGGGDFVSGLNLTAMMDIMTILLVYLIKVYADAPENLTLNDDLRPPTSSAPDNVTPSVSVMISKTAILVDQKPVLTLSGGKVVSEDPKNVYQPLAQALTARVEIINAIHVRGGAEFDGNVMIIADEDTPYELVSNVLYQAGKAQFTSYRLVVRHGASGSGG